jgi:long-chain acyl-CoA synthetase
VLSFEGVKRRFAKRPRLGRTAARASATVPERRWLARYEDGVPAEIDPDCFRSLVELFDASVASFSSRPAYASLGHTMTFADLDRLSRCFAAYLQQRLGVTRGERVALMLPNTLAYPVCLFGALRAGATVVNTNPLYTPRELEQQLADSGAETIVVFENIAHTVADVLSRRGTALSNVIVVRLGDLLGRRQSLLVNAVVKYGKRLVPAYELPEAVSLPAALREGAQLELDPVELGPDDVAFLQYTGGTTGVAKGAMLTHRNLVANIEQMRAWFTTLVPSGEVMITALPLYHVFALTVNCLLMLRVGALSVLVVDPRNCDALIRELRRNRFSLITGVNTLFNVLLDHPRFAQLDFSSLKLAIAGGMAAQKAVAERWQSVTGVTLVEGYGLTEASPVTTCNPLDIDAFTGSIGLPLPSTEASVRGERGRELPPGEIGELHFRGPQVMRGYWQRPDETAQVLGTDGFLATGDLGYVDEAGFAYVVDRAKDVIVVSGFNVYPNEVEGVAAAHPGVREVAVVGAPDPRSGEAGVMFVVRSDEDLTSEELLDHLQANLARYKLPRRIEFRTELPKSAVGKILRRALRDDAAHAIGVGA